MSWTAAKKMRGQIWRGNLLTTCLLGTSVFQIIMWLEYSLFTPPPPCHSNKLIPKWWIFSLTAMTFLHLIYYRADENNMSHCMPYNKNLATKFLNDLGFFRGVFTFIEACYVYSLDWKGGGESTRFFFSCNTAIFRVHAQNQSRSPH